MQWFLIHLNRRTVQECALARSRPLTFLLTHSHADCMPWPASGRSHCEAMGVGHFCGSMPHTKLFASVTGQRCIGLNWSGCWLDGYLSIRPEWNFSLGMCVPERRNVAAGSQPSQFEKILQMIVETGFPEPSCPPLLLHCRLNEKPLAHNSCNESLQSSTPSSVCIIHVHSLGFIILLNLLPWNK